ncbi:MAG: efflux RND transporter permease subunit [Acidobacteria bacterium]|nr:MAG: efflux RND transporter permease subunit [Acidobacteriota bacterium]
MDSINWFARNPVAANLIMVLIIGGGLVSLFGGSIVQEVFPEFAIDLITIQVPYPGAAPEEAEEAICLRVEEAVQGLNGIKKLTSRARENIGVVTIHVESDADSRKLLDEVKARIDAIDTFPDETEKPIIQELTNRRQVIDVAIYGNTDELSLRHLAERVRDDLAALPEMSIVELSNARPYEISIEVSEDTLRRHGLTFDRIATAIRRSSLDLPGGSIKTPGGEVLLRTKGQAYTARDFEQLVLLTRPDGTRLTIADVATVVDGFADTDQSTKFQGEPAMLVSVFRVGGQDALSIGDAVSRYIERAERWMPEGVSLATWNNASKILRDRRDLLLRNGATGMILVFITLALFLGFRLALWVMVGMLLSFMGAIWLMPVLGVSINMISLFAFILVLGIVVDDAIIAGENIYTHQHRTGKALQGAIDGAREISVPVVFAVLTTIAAFVPLIAITGMIGKVMYVIPLVVISCLVWSLIESLWILPAHLSHYKHRDPNEPRKENLWQRFQGRFANKVELAMTGYYRPFLNACLRRRYLTISVALSLLILTAGLILGGRLKWVFFPEVESDYVSATITMPPGTPVEVTAAAVLWLEESADQVRRELEENYGTDQFRYVITALGEHPFATMQQQNSGALVGGERAAHLGEVTIELQPAETRSAASADVADRWRELTGRIPGTVEQTFSSSLFEPGKDIDIQLTGIDLENLRAAKDELESRLGEYAGVFEIGNSFRDGKEEIRLAIKPAAELTGLTLSDLGRQVRQAFHGEEAQRIQRGRDEIKVMVRYPEDERLSIANLERMRIRLPGGIEVPFSEVAEAVPGRGYASITRIDRRRAINVTADVDSSVASAGTVIKELADDVLPKILARYPGVSYTFEGQQAEQRETIAGLVRGFIIAILVIFALLAIPLRSYLQPAIIMIAIPFGIVGAVLGHIALGYDLSILSMFGLVALTGVVINDGLVMVDFINRFRERNEGDIHRAVREAGVARFRPIVLTSLTTFVGLFPLLLEKSMQARFLIPMAVSLAFGVLFATLITLILIPAAYIVLEDLVAFSRRLSKPAAESSKDRLPAGA